MKESSICPKAVSTSLTWTCQDVSSREILMQYLLPPLPLLPLLVLLYTIIMLIFRGSKFSRIAALKEFVEKFCEFMLPMCVTAQWLKF